MSREIYYDISYDSNLVSDFYVSFIDLASAAGAAAGDLQRRVIVQREINRLEDQLHSYNRQILEFKSTIFAISPSDIHAKSAETVTDTDAMTIGELRATVAAAAKLNSELAAHAQDVLENYVRNHRPSLEELKKSAKSSSKLLLTASAVMPVFDRASTQARALADKQFLENYVSEVSELLGIFRDQHPDYQLSDEVLELANAMLVAENKAQAMNIFDQLQANLQLAVKDATNIAERRKAIALEERLKHESEMIGALIIDAMKETGAEVSGIEESCFVEDGEIYVKLPGHPNNAARFTIDRKSGKYLKSELIRDDGFEQSADAKQKEDKAWHDAWCNPQGLGRFRKSMAFKNVALTLTESLEYDAAIPTDPVAKKEQPQSLRDRTAYEADLVKRLTKPSKRQRGN